MNDPQRPAVLPEQFRPRDPQPKPRVETMSHSGYVEPDAIRIDANWGVWIDPKAEVKPGTDPLGNQGPRGTLRVHRSGSPYIVHMLAAYANEPRSFKKEIHTSYDGAGFVPVSELK